MPFLVRVVIICFLSSSFVDFGKGGFATWLNTKR